MELWQMDIVGGFLIADGTRAKALTGLDDHARFCVSGKLMARERTRPVCEGLAAAMRTYGVPEQILTDNGKVFTGRFNKPVVEVLFDRILRENGVKHRLTQPRSPTTTGKIERFHGTLRRELHEMWRQTRKTVLFVTHDVGEAVELSNRILVFAKGGRLEDDLQIDLPFPRDPAEEEVAVAKAQVLRKFEELDLVAS